MHQVAAGLRFVIRSLGWWSSLLLVLAVLTLVGWWRWDRGRQLPLPPQAQNVSSQILGALAKRTTFVVPGSVSDVRAFYRDTLPQRGWAYCGTQSTPGCTNLIVGSGAVGEQVDVYRRAVDLDQTGQTIEVWPTEHPAGGTVVAVFEANLAR